LLHGLWSKRGSLLTMLTVRLVVTTAVLTAGLLLALYWQLQKHVDNILDRNLTSQALEIARYIKRGPDGTLSLRLPTELARAYSDTKSDYFFQVRNASDALVFASSGGAAALDDMTSIKGLGPEFFLLAKPKQPKIYAASVPVAGDFGDLLIRVGQSESHGDILIDELLEEFVENVGWVLPLILTLFFIVNFVTIRQSLAPVKTISAMAAEIGPSSERTLPDTGLPDEIRPLVQAVNSAFARLDTALRMQREFTADAAHELRTPLAVLNANIDTLQDVDSKSALKRDLRTMIRIVDQLLKFAQLDAFVLDTDQQANLCTIATDVAARLGHLAIEQGKAVSVGVPDGPVFVHGDRIILEHCLSNLVENALSHTQPGKGVEITVDPAGTIHVDDQGPGVPETERVLIFQRFWRKNRNTSGAGIGLSIVAKIAEAHQGTISVSSAPGGGARFSLSLRLCA